MMSANCFGKHFRLNMGVSALFLAVFLLASCGGGKSGSDQRDETDVETNEDESEVWTDTLVYDIPETPLTEAVDESFLDFLFTFLHRPGFQQQRAAYPVPVIDEQGEVVETLRNGRSVSQAVQLSGQDYFLMLLGEAEDPYDYMSQEVSHAEMQSVDLVSGHRSSYLFDRREEAWQFTGIRHESHGRHANFMHFIQQFATDSLFQRHHLSSEIFVSLPSTEDEMETVEGNIDPGQWEVFAPELPQGTVLLLDMGGELSNPNGMKLVKCGVASSMMEILTFRREDNEWKLVRYEE